MYTPIKRPMKTKGTPIGSKVIFLRYSDTTALKANIEGKQERMVESIKSKAGLNMMLKKTKAMKTQRILSPAFTFLFYLFTKTN